MKAQKTGLGIVNAGYAGKSGDVKQVQTPNPAVDVDAPNPIAQQLADSNFKSGAAAAKSSTSAPASTEKLDLKPEQREAMAKIKGTCPFIGSAMATGSLPIRNDPDKPLANIDDVVKLGNLGGGDLGTVLRFFASGNHALMVGDTPGKLDREVPPGTFSLDLAGSQGSHPGHSGILNGNPLQLNAGGFNEADWGRLKALSQDGYVSQSAFGTYIAENLLRDPSSKVFSAKTFGKLGLDALGVLAKTGPALLEGVANLFRKNDTHEAQRDAVEKLAKLAGEENLVGSAGEFALLFAFLKNKPGAKEIDGEPALALSDLELMFRDKKFPEGWETWPKKSIDWVASTTALTVAAGKEYLRLKHDHGNHGVI